MADHDIDATALAGVYSTAALGQLLVRRGVISGEEFHEALNGLTTTLKDNPRREEILAVLRQLYPNAAL